MNKTLGSRGQKKRKATVASGKPRWRPLGDRKNSPGREMTSGPISTVPRGKRKWHELDLLCRSGMGPVIPAPAICRTLREIIGADAASLFWLDESGAPAGVFHEAASPGAMALFVNEYDRLFAGPGEINVSQISAGRGAPAGVLFQPDPAYFRSNTLNLLVRPSGHYHTLDLRVDVGGHARAVVMLFREERRPFREQDVALITQALPIIQQAFACRLAAVSWDKDGASGHLLTERSGSRILMIDDRARDLLGLCTVVGQELSLVGPMVRPPRFVADLCRQLGCMGLAESEIDIGSGRLRVIASPISAPDGRGGDHVLVTLEMLRARPLAIVESLLATPLSPLQRSIALDAALGGARGASPATSSIGKEALKKHLAVIYRTVGVNSWDELGKAFT